MRMTNEEFQAEVLRRSQVYLAQKKRSRKQFFVRTAAFAACFVLIGGALMFRISMDVQNNSLYSILSDHVRKDSAAEYCESSAAADQILNNAETFEEEAWCEGEVSCDDVADEKQEQESGAEASPEADHATDLTAAEFFDVLSVNPMPESLGGYTLEWAPDAKFSTHGQYAFLYHDENGNRMLTVYMTEYRASALDEITVRQIVDGSFHTEFSVNRALLSVFSEGDFPGDEDAFRSLAEELKEQLTIS